MCEVGNDSANFRAQGTLQSIVPRSIFNHCHFFRCVLPNLPVGKDNVFLKTAGKTIWICTKVVVPCLFFLGGFLYIDRLQENLKECSWVWELISSLRRAIIFVDFSWTYSPDFVWRSIYLMIKLRNNFRGQWRNHVRLNVVQRLVPPVLIVKDLVWVYHEWKECA